MTRAVAPFRSPRLLLRSCVSSPWWSSVAAVAVALLIGLFAEFARPHAFDEPVLEGIQLAHPMKEIAWFFNDYLRDSGIPALWAMSIAWLLFIRRRPGLAALFVVAILVGPLNELLKEFFARPRPAGDFIIRENPSGMSFPSGHTMTAVAFFGLWIMVAPLVLPRGAHWPVRIAAASVIVLTAVSRVWVAAHWPTDVIAGILFGAAFVGLVWASRHDIDRIAEWLHMRLHSLDVWLVGHTSHAVQPAEIDPIDYHLTLR